MDETNSKKPVLGDFQYAGQESQLTSVAYLQELTEHSSFQNLRSGESPFSFKVWGTKSLVRVDSAKALTGTMKLDL